jgi:hypothetical protein
MDTLYALMGDDVSEGFRPPPNDKKRANGCGGDEKEERKRSYRLWFWGGACL